MAKPQVETLEHKEAYARYLAMGKDRSLAKVAEELGKSETALANWSETFGWVKRVEEAEIRIGELVERRTEESLAQADVKICAIADKVLEIYMKRLEGAFEDDGKTLKVRGYKPGALDAKIWADLKRQIRARGETGAGGPAFDSSATEEIGVDRLERIVIERVERITRARKSGPA